VLGSPVARVVLSEVSTVLRDMSAAEKQVPEVLLLLVWR